MARTNQKIQSFYILDTYQFDMTQDAYNSINTAIHNHPLYIEKRKLELAVNSCTRKDLILDPQETKIYERLAVLEGLVEAEALKIVDSVLGEN